MIIPDSTTRKQTAAKFGQTCCEQSRPINRRSPLANAVVSPAFDPDKAIIALASNERSPNAARTFILTSIHRDEWGGVAGLGETDDPYRVIEFMASDLGVSRSICATIDNNAANSRRNAIPALT